MRTPFYLAHKNDMVALFVAAAVEAFKRGCRASQQGRSTGSFDKRDIGKPIHVFAGKSLGQRLLISTQNIDGVM